MLWNGYSEMKEIYIRKESEEKTHPTPPKGTP